MGLITHNELGDWVKVAANNAEVEALISAPKAIAPTVLGTISRSITSGMTASWSAFRGNGPERIMVGSSIFKHEAKEIVVKALTTGKASWVFD